MRVAVWVSHAWSVGADADSVLPHALPDVTDRGLGDRLRLWRDLGESAVYAALPRPGDRGLLPDCPPDAYDAATGAGEAVFVPGIGSMAVPRFVGLDPSARGSGLAWDVFNAAAVPVHRLAGVDLPGADRRLRHAVHAAIDALGDGGWVDAWQRDHGPGEDRLWSLPPDLPDRARAVIVRSASVLQIAEAGLVHATGSAGAGLEQARRHTLLGLREAASAALEAATAAAAGYFAAQSRSTRS